MVWGIYFIINFIGLMFLFLPIIQENDSIFSLLWFPCFYRLLRNDLNLNKVGIILAMIFSTILFLPLILICLIVFCISIIIYGLIHGFIKIFQKRS